MQTDARGWSDAHHDFDDRGRRWAARMLERLKTHWLEVPLVWPGTREQALAIVNAFADESASGADRERMADAVQNGARHAWRDLVGSA